MQSPAVSRDPWKLKVFALSDEVVVDVYRAPRRFPMEERFGLQAPAAPSCGLGPRNLVPEA